MQPDSDPRVYFAAERTLLAWLRTGIAVIGLGFLVARFRVFLMILRGPLVDQNQWASSLIGIGLVVLGTVMISASTWQHRRFISRLPRQAAPLNYSMGLSVGMSTLVAIAGAALTIYLTLSMKN